MEKNNKNIIFIIISVILIIIIVFFFFQKKEGRITRVFPSNEFIQFSVSNNSYGF